jgi:hypothetical protein
MKIIVFSAALLACTTPALAQLDATIPGRCEAALTSPGVPSAIVVLPIPTPVPAGRGEGSTQRPGTRSSLPVVHPGVIVQAAPTPFGNLPGVPTGSGIGSIGMGGIGSIGMGGIGSIGASGLGLLPSPSLSPVPFAAPVAPGWTKPYARPQAVPSPPSVFICP